MKCKGGEGTLRSHTGASAILVSFCERMKVLALDKKNQELMHVAAKLEGGGGT